MRRFHLYSHASGVYVYDSNCGLVFPKSFVRISVQHVGYAVLCISAEESDSDSRLHFDDCQYGSGKSAQVSRMDHLVEIKGICH